MQYAVVVYFDRGLFAADARQVVGARGRVVFHPFRAPFYHGIVDGVAQRVAEYQHHLLVLDEPVVEIVHDMVAVYEFVSVRPDPQVVSPGSCGIFFRCSIFADERVQHPFVGRRAFHMQFAELSGIGFIDEYFREVRWLSGSGVCARQAAVQRSPTRIVLQYFMARSGFYPAI